MSEKHLITEIVKKEDTNNCLPILVDFQNGILNEKYISKGNFVLAQNKNTKKKAGIFSINNEIYHGNIRENEDEPTNTYIAVKRGNKIRLIEIDQCTLSHEVHSQEINTFNKVSNKEVALKILMKNFGGKKSKIYLERKERSKVNLNIIKTQLNKTVDETILTEENEKVNENPLELPYNKNATKIEELYDLTEFLPNDLLDSLQQEAEAVQKFETKELPISSEFIINEIIRKKQIENESERLTFLKVLIYLDGLLNYIKLKRSIPKNVELSKISDKITNDILKRFSPKDAAKSLLTASSIDKAICYFIILSILIQPGLQIDGNILTSELANRKRKFVTLCKLSRVKINRNTNNLTFTLNNDKVELNFTRKRKTI